MHSIWRCHYGLGVSMGSEGCPGGLGIPLGLCAGCSLHGSDMLNFGVALSVCRAGRALGAGRFNLKFSQCNFGD